MSLPVVAIDGPSGVGKGTVCQRLSRTLGFHLLDSGALYRLVALAARRRGMALSEDNDAALGALARQLDVHFMPVEDAREPLAIYLDGELVTQEVRSDALGQDASRVAALPLVRAGLLERQRAFLQVPGLVADGRDMGTVVFPQAAVKVFLTASVEVRAERRYLQLLEKGLDVSLPRLLDSMRERDQRDSRRAASPLRPADDAWVIDSTGRSADAVYAEVLGRVDAAGLLD